jgi:hypothetical protein
MLTNVIYKAGTVAIDVEVEFPFEHAVSRLPLKYVFPFPPVTGEILDDYFDISRAGVIVFCESDIR